MLSARALFDQGVVKRRELSGIRSKALSFPLDIEAVREEALEQGFPLVHSLVAHSIESTAVLTVGKGDNRLHHVLEVIDREGRKTVVGDSVIDCTVAVKAGFGLVISRSCHVL